jgi:hydrogenase expression/formation protein HypC
MCLGTPARIVELDPELPELAVVERADGRFAINVGMLEPGSVAVGDWVLVHVGFAVERMTAEEAQETSATVCDLVDSRPAEALISWGDPG